MRILPGEPRLGRVLRRRNPSLWCSNPHPAHCSERREESSWPQPHSNSPCSNRRTRTPCWRWPRRSASRSPPGRRSRDIIDKILETTGSQLVVDPRRRGRRPATARAHRCRRLDGSTPTAAVDRVVRHSPRRRRRGRARTRRRAARRLGDRAGARAANRPSAGDSTPRTDQNRNGQSRGDRDTVAIEPRRPEPRRPEPRRPAPRSDRRATRATASGGVDRNDQGGQGERNRNAQGGAQRHRQPHRQPQQRQPRQRGGRQQPPSPPSAQGPRRPGGPAGRGRRAHRAGPGFESTEPVEVEGYLDLRDEGYGFLRVNGLPAQQATTPTSR